MNTTEQTLEQARRERLAQLRRDIQTEEGRVVALREALTESERFLEEMREAYAATWVLINHGA